MASTGVKNPGYSDTLYVSDLVVADTVNTMPEKTLWRSPTTARLRATRSPAVPRRRRRCFDALEHVGIDLTDVFLTIEDEGVDKFEKSWKELLDTAKGQQDAAG